MVKILDSSTNFKIWHKYNLFNNGCGELIGFINANILDTNPELFQEIFKDIENKSEDFYKTLKEFLNIDFEISFDIDYSKRLYKYEEEKDSIFNSKTFVLNTLNLLPNFKEKVLQIIGE